MIRTTLLFLSVFMSFITMGLNYDRLRDSKGKPENERILFGSGDFPHCKGLYPDCPDTPDLMLSMCELAQRPKV